MYWNESRNSIVHSTNIFVTETLLDASDKAGNKTSKSEYSILDDEKCNGEK